MIRIIKPIVAPRCLIDEGVPQTTKDCGDFDLYPGEFAAETRKFEFLKSIYSDTEVKQLLMALQNNKCCYCEREFDDAAYLHVEHFRPKGAYKQKRREKRKFPGYYWLVYVWRNLYLSCHACNSSHKGDLFPLLDDSKRAAKGLSHHYDESEEEPLFIDPGNEDPREHIRFRKDAPYHLSNKGRITIKELKLDRHKPIIKARLEKINILDKAVKIIEISKNQPQNSELLLVAQEFIEFLSQSVMSKGLSSMSKDYLIDYILNSKS